MFEPVALGRSYSKKEFAKIEPELRTKLFNAQWATITNNIPVVIIIAGVDEAGRGDLVNVLSEWMDAKNIRNYTFWYETDEERQRPFAWRFWRTLPGCGKMGIYFGGWFSNSIRMLTQNNKEAEESFEKRMHRWVRFENTLTSSGTLIVKFWLHINKKVFKERIKQREKKHNLIKFTSYDKNTSGDYDDLICAAAKAIRITDRQNAPWYLIDAEDRNFKIASVAQTLITAIDNAVKIKKQPKIIYDIPVINSDVRTLDKIDLTADISPDDYKEQLPVLQEEIRKLTYKAYNKGISSTLIFEGWDAAGKGGAIRRLSQSIDARISQLIPVSAPTDEELAHNYLWRFWRHIPMAGFVTIYDRSWYGRVLVERVDKLASPEDWGRAYAEINDFEEQLVEKGNILMKFWLHISEDEQLRRFKEREEITWKQYKITPDDWHNREKRQDYMVATDEMFMRTSTDIAPWQIVSAEHKRHARITVLRAYRDMLLKKLGKHNKD